MLKRFICWLRGHHLLVIVDVNCARESVVGTATCKRCGKTLETVTV
jgi:transcription elongation factor Elf1